MSRVEVPARTIVRCDGCGDEITGEPDVRILVTQVARDFQGMPVGGSRIERDLCGRCGPRVIEAMNEAPAWRA